MTPALPLGRHQVKVRWDPILKRILSLMQKKVLSPRLYRACARSSHLLRDSFSRRMTTRQSRTRHALCRVLMSDRIECIGYVHWHSNVPPPAHPPKPPNKKRQSHLVPCRHPTATCQILMRQHQPNNRGDSHSKSSGKCTACRLAFVVKIARRYSVLSLSGTNFQNY